MKVGVNWVGLAACLLAGSAHAALFTVPPGDGAALGAALEEAASNGEPDVVELAPNATYHVGFLEFSGRLVVNGNGARITTAEPEFGAFTVAVDSNVTIQDLHFQRIDARRAVSVINNSGRLRLVRISMTHSIASRCGNAICLPGWLVVNNPGASLVVANATFTSNDLTSFGTSDDGLDTQNAETVIRSRGSALLRNVTIAGNAGKGIGGDGETRIVNSIVAGNGQEDCDAENIQSLGHNIDSDGSCGFDQPGDQPNTDPRLGEFGHHGGLLPSISLQAGSPAISAANRDECPVLDARGFVRADHPRWDCDIGAFEQDGSASDIDEALTATWFSVREDGHFFTIQVIGDDREQVLVHWNTFDAEGNPLWLQGVGAINGHRSDMVLYEYGGMRFPDFDTADRTITPWGTLSLAFASCWRAVAGYEALEPGLGSGHSRLIRLINTAGLSCGGG